MIGHKMVRHHFDWLALPIMLGVAGCAGSSLGPSTQTVIPSSSEESAKNQPCFDNLTRDYGYSKEYGWSTITDTLQAERAAHEKALRDLTAAAKAAPLDDPVLSRNLASGPRFVLVVYFRDAAPYPSHGTHRDSSSVRANVGRGGTG